MLRLILFALLSCGVVISASVPLVADGPVGWQCKSSQTGDLAAPNSGDQQTCCIAADLDNDGITDFVVGERTKAPAVVWYRSQGQSWDRQIVHADKLRPEAGGVCLDVDRDGDLDIVLGQDASGNEMWWWENPCPKFDKPWTRRWIKKSGPRKHHDQTAGDFDGDGKVELVSWNQGGKQLLLFELPSDPRQADSWSATSIFSWSSGRELEGFPSHAVDIDLDGQIDIVGGGRWFKHTDGKFEPQVIDDQQRFTQCAAGQLVDGGRPEVVFSPGDMDGIARWYQWDGKQWMAHDLGFVVHGHTCDVRDINGDGHADIFIGEMGDPGAGDNAKIYIWYGNGQVHFTRPSPGQGRASTKGYWPTSMETTASTSCSSLTIITAPRLDILLNAPAK